MNQLDGEDTVMQNGEESTKIFSIYVAILVRKGVWGGNETTNVIADADSKGEGFAPQNGNVMPSTKTDGANSIPDVARCFPEGKRRRYYFEDRYDLVKFIKLIKKVALYAHHRDGPYACAEWNFR
uniref:Glycoside hydrolase 35 catalytic domain-containing protein n=1 Tax=Lactuca sativa TaxID=4236 RepID=A0A9R1WGP6_LACSA|nr:hypothetical protein LSAT_V11C200057270 [Lactuca sativa]